MKNLVLILFILPICFFGQKKIEILVTNQKNETVSNAKVELYSQADSLVTHQFTDEKGKAIFEINQSAIVKFVITDLEYEAFSKSFNENEIKDKEQLHFILKKNEHEIEEVVVTKQKPIVKRKIDRLEFNVENSNISSLNAWEILKKTPGVNVIDNTIKIKGSSKILVTINDKKVMLSPDELQNLLENTSGEEIQSVEVITNPPAKYEASGSAVLNIVMKKAKLEGYKGTLSGRFIQSKYAKGAVTTSHQYQKNKFSTMLSYSKGAGDYLREGTDVVYYEESGTTWKSVMNRKDSNHNQNTLDFSTDYELDSLTNFSLNYTGYFSPKTKGLYDVPTEITNTNHQIESTYRTLNDHHSRTINNTLSFQADRKLNENSSLTWVNYFATNNYTKSEDIQTYLNFVNQDPKFSRFATENLQDIQLFSTQLDYSWKKDKWQLESGAKYSLVKTNSVLAFADNEFGDLQNRPEKSNDFNYKEYNYAAYASMTLELKKWSLKAGLRAENTSLEGIVSEPYAINKNNYLKLFPTFYAQYTTDNKHQFGFSYGKRISRPSYSWLNPAKSYYNLFSYFKGDPNLKATIIHNLNFTYNFKEWNFDFYYRKEVDPSMEISYQNPETNQLIYHFTNIQKGQAYGVDIYKNFTLKDWWSLSVSESLEHNENYFYGMDGNLYKNKIFSLNSNISTSFTLDKKTDWNLQLGNTFYTGGVQGNLRIGSASTTYLIMNRKFYQKRLEASLYFNDILRTSGDTIRTRYANQNNYFLDYLDAQSFSITLKYNFGNQKLKATKRIKSADEQDRM
ncbi:TonB-dependent receptor domain-containing protein [Chryseobacterium sp. TY4]